MDCSDFLDSYSDFRDGRIIDVRRCGACITISAIAGHAPVTNASVRHGVRALGEIDPSPDFRRRSGRASRRPRNPPEPIGARAAGIAAALMLAAPSPCWCTRGSDSVTPPVASPLPWRKRPRVRLRSRHVPFAGGGQSWGSVRYLQRPLHISLP